jgi:hypothetical protein
MQAMQPVVTQHPFLAQPFFELPRHPTPQTRSSERTLLDLTQKHKSPGKKTKKK